MYDRQFFGKYDKTQIWPLRLAKARITIRERSGFARARIPSAFVPSDELVALLYDCHDHAADAPMSLHIMLGYSEQCSTETCCLQRGSNGQHAKVGVIASML